MSHRTSLLLGIWVSLLVAAGTLQAQSPPLTPIPAGSDQETASAPVSLLSPSLQLRPERSVSRPDPASPKLAPPTNASVSVSATTTEPRSSEDPPLVTSASASPTEFAIPEATVTGGEFSSADAWAEQLSPRQRAELENLVEAIPRYRADAFEDGFLAKAGAVVFPEISFVRVGQVTMAGGLVTAIRTRNPFGLLNPLILGISW